MGDRFSYEDHEGNRVYRYTKKLRKTDEGVVSLFKDIVVIDEQGAVHSVPCVWSNADKLQQTVLQENTSSELNLDGTPKLRVDRVRLPMIGVYSNEIFMEGSTPTVAYCVTVWSLFQEDMNQILEQIILKFDNKKNCKLKSITRNHTAEDTLTIKVLQSMLTLTVEGIGVPVETHE